MKVTLLKINMHITTNEMHMKFETEIPKRTILRCRNHTTCSQEAILKVTLLKINSLLPKATIPKLVKFEVETTSKLDLRSEDHVVHRQRDGRTRWITYTDTTPSNFVGRGYNFLIPLTSCQFRPSVWLPGVIKNRTQTPMLEDDGNSIGGHIFYCMSHHGS